jgi:hypothetical protein
MFPSKLPVRCSSMALMWPSRTCFNGSQKATHVSSTSSTFSSTPPPVSPSSSHVINMLTFVQGVGIIYLVLRFLTTTLTERFGLSGFESGKYGNPPSFVFWMKQTTVYVLSITTMKLLVVGLFVIWPGIFSVGQWLLSWTGDGSNFQIVLCVFIQLGNV